MIILIWKKESVNEVSSRIIRKNKLCSCAHNFDADIVSIIMRNFNYNTQKQFYLHDDNKSFTFTEKRRN